MRGDSPRKLASDDHSACPLRRTLASTGITIEVLTGLHAHIERPKFRRGEILFHMCAPADSVHCLRHGVVKLVRYDSDGTEHIVRILGAGEVAGLESIFRDEFAHTAIALGNVETCRIPFYYFRNLIAQHEEFRMHILAMSQEALRQADAWLAELVYAAIPARVRTARLLLRLRIDDGDRIHWLNLEDMGSILGVAPETVSRVLSGFQRAGILWRVGSGFANRHYRGDIAALTRISREGEAHRWRRQLRQARVARGIFRLRGA